MIKSSISSLLSSPSYPDAFNRSPNFHGPYLPPSSLRACYIHAFLSSCSSFRRLIAAGPQKLSSRSLRIRYLTLVASIIASYTTPTRQAILSHLRFCPSAPKPRSSCKKIASYHTIPYRSLSHPSSSYIAISRIYWFRLWSLQSLPFSCEYNCMLRILDF